ncbi:MAG: hypothetical protein WBM31_13905, partial [Pseudolabrys sp.]
MPNRTLRSLSHRVGITTDQNFTRHLLGTLRALYLVSKIIVGKAAIQSRPEGKQPEGIAMTTAVIHGTLSASEHSAQLRKAIIASTIG